MDRLISLQAAIDALKAHEDYKGYLHGDFEEILEALPSAQPQIIHCSDCKYNYGLSHGLEFNPDDIVCSYFDTDGMSADDFCSYAERRGK